MTLDTLPRIRTVDTLTFDLQDTFAHDVANRLGYRPLQAQRVGVLAQHTLYDKLLAIGVEPFEPKAVDRYKRVRMGRFLGQTMAIQLGVLVAAVLLLALAAHQPEDSARQFLDIIGGAAMLIGGSAITWTAKNPLAWEWREMSLSMYDQPVPKDVLALALKVKAAIPSASFSVHELRKTRVVFDPDPFLVVNVDNAQAYIAVWDEATFDAR